MKNSDSLKHKLEIIRSFVTLTTDDLKVLEENLKKIEGFSLGAKEVAEKFKEYVSNNQIEIKKLLNEQKMTQADANLFNGSLMKSLKFVKDTSRDADRMFYVRHGEIIGIKSRINKMISLGSSTEEELFRAEKEEELELIASESAAKEVLYIAGTDISETKDENSCDLKMSNLFSAESQQDKTENARIRPDKNSKTKIGRAAIDLAERRKNASKLTDSDTQMTTDKVSKKRHKKTMG